MSEKMDQAADAFKNLCNRLAPDFGTTNVFYAWMQAGKAVTNAAGAVGNAAGEVGTSVGSAASAVRRAAYAVERHYTPESER